MIAHKYINQGEWLYDSVKRDYVKVIAKYSNGIKVSSGDSYLHHQGAYSRLESRDDRQKYEATLDKIDPNWRLYQPRYSAY